MSRSVRTWLAAIVLCMGCLHMAAVANATPAARGDVELQDGDLVFRRGGDLTSPLILAQSGGSRFTHVGLVRLQRGRAMVIHALPEEERNGRRGTTGGVLIEPFATFVAPDVAVEHAVFRLDSVPLAVRQRAATLAAQQVGKAFDSLFLISDETRVYCTELVASAYAKAGLPAASRLPRARIALFPEPILLPETLSRWRALARVRLQGDDAR